MAVPVLFNRDLVLLVLGAAISATGTAMALATLFLHFFAVGAGPWSVAGVLLADAAPIVLLSPIAGQLADRYDSRVLIVVSSLVQAMASAGIALGPPDWLLFLLVASLGCGTAISAPTVAALLPRVVGEDRISKAVSLMATATGVTAVAGPGFAGVMFEAYGLTGPFVVNAVSCLALTAVGIGVRTRRRAAVAAATVPCALDGVRLLFGRRVISSLAFVLVGFAVVGEAVTVVEVYLVQQTFQQPAAVYGLIVSTWALTLLIGSVMVGFLKLDRLAQAVAASGLALAAAALAVSVVPSIGWLFAVFAIGGFANGVLNVATTSLMIRWTPDAERGRVMATFTGLARGAALVAFLLGGWLAGLLSPRQVFGLSGMVSLLLLALTLPIMLRYAASKRDSHLGYEG